MQRILVMYGARHSVSGGSECGIYWSLQDFAFKPAAADLRSTGLRAVSNRPCDSLVEIDLCCLDCSACQVNSFNLRFGASALCLNCSYVTEWLVFKLRLQVSRSTFATETDYDPSCRQSQRVLNWVCLFQKHCLAPSAGTSITAICFHWKIR